MEGYDDESENELFYLKAQLDHYKEEAKAANDQVNCLLLLIKSAMYGNTEAINHLAKLTGVKPQNSSFLTSSNETNSYNDNNNNQAQIHTVRAVKNWTVLTTGLLHQKYKIQTKLLREESLHQLAQRALYLDDIKSYHNQEVQHAYLTKKSRPTSGLIQPNRVDATRQTKRTNTPDPSGLKAEDFFTCESGSNTNSIKDSAMARLQQTNPTYETPQQRAAELNYDDPHRYEQAGLYDHTSFVAKSRPVSGKSLQDSDARRARPKSSAIGGRPMKYETTRPVSSKKPTQGQQKSTSVKPRTTSAASKKNQTQSNNQTTEQRQNTDPIQKFSDDLQMMGDMEQQFKLTAMNLQKKIGIRPDGFVAP